MDRATDLARRGPSPAGLEPADHLQIDRVKPESGLEVAPRANPEAAVTLDPATGQPRRPALNADVPAEPGAIGQLGRGAEVVQGQSEEGRMADLQFGRGYQVVPDLTVEPELAAAVGPAGQVGQEGQGIAERRVVQPDVEAEPPRADRPVLGPGGAPRQAAQDQAVDRPNPPAIG
jgi:hypothetical protein